VLAASVLMPSEQTTELDDRWVQVADANSRLASSIDLS
jgi:hypothetical protein